jgi:hypothetical protein
MSSGARKDWAVVYTMPSGTLPSVAVHTTYELACEYARKLAREHPGAEIGVFGSITFLVWTITEAPGRYDRKTGDLR